MSIPVGFKRLPPKQNRFHKPGAGSHSLFHRFEELRTSLDFATLLVEAVAQLEECSSLHGNDDPATFESWLLVLKCLAQIGDGNLAYAILEPVSAKVLVAQPADHSLHAKFVHMRGRLLKDNGEFDESLKCYKDALAYLDTSELGVEDELADIWESIGHAYRRKHHRSGKPEDKRQAIVAMNRSVSVRLEIHGPESAELAKSLVWRGWLLGRTGEFSRAEQDLKRALRLVRARFGNESPLLAEPLYFLGELKRSQGHVQEGDAYFRQWNQLSLAATAPTSLAQGTRFWNWAKASEGESQGFLESAQRAFVMRGNAAWALARLKWLELASGSEDLLDRHREQSFFWNGAMREALSNEAASTDDKISVIQKFLTAEARRIDVENKLIQADPVWNVGLRLEEIQQALNAGEAILGWHKQKRLFGQRPIRGFLIKKQGPIEWVGGYRGASFGSEWIQPLRAFANTLQQDSAWTTRIGKNPTGEKLAVEVWRRLIEPFASKLDDVDHLIYTHLPEGLSLPLEALTSPRGERVVDRFSVSYAASPCAFVMQRKFKEFSRNFDSPESALLVGNPIFPPGGEQIEETSTAVISRGLCRSLLDGETNSVQGLPRLPFSGREIDNLEPLFDHSIVLSGEEATEEAFDAIRRGGRLSGFEVLHFATHGVVDRRKDPGSSLLVMSIDPNQDKGGIGLVRAQEMFLGWSLDAQLVTLSACQTGIGGPGVDENEVVGFYHALLRSGAQSLLVSKWKVDDEATELLMSRFYRNWLGRYADDRGFGVGKEMTKAQALREAKVWLREFKTEQGTQPFLNPVYWAGFILVGDPD